jgi:hypothetical protein
MTIEPINAEIPSIAIDIARNGICERALAR